MDLKITPLLTHLTPTLSRLLLLLQLVHLRHPHKLLSPITTGTMQDNSEQDKLTIVSANVRGLQTNIGDLTHSHVLPHNPDVVAAVEAFLNESVPENYGQIQGYTRWYRRDRARGTFGGVAVCFRRTLQFSIIDVTMPEHLELMFFKLWRRGGEAILLCVCYRPQWQGREPLLFLHANLDALMQQHSCKQIIVLGDMNQHLVARTFNELLSDYGLNNHVDFPTHTSGSSLDPVLTDLPTSVVTCRPTGSVGSSDHLAVLTTIKLAVDRDEGVSRTNWLWRQADWRGLREELASTDWSGLLRGSVEEQVQKFNDVLLACQKKYVRCQTYKSKPRDQPWFGFHCRNAAEEKSRAWQRYKMHPSQRTQQAHKAACKRMKRVQKEAIRRWRDTLRHKLSGQNVGSKEWWSSVKQQQGFVSDDTIPPLTAPDGGLAMRNRDKAQLLAAHFSKKMQVPEPERVPPLIPARTRATLDCLHIHQTEVEKLLLQVDTKKALGPDNISPHLLRRCASELSAPLTLLFRRCLSSKTWPSQWKEARVVPIHKKSSRADPSNYRPISLLSVVGKLLEAIIASKVTSFMETHHLLSPKQFGFRRGRSAADLLLLQSAAWNTALDGGSDVYVIALDIAGAFDRVWHRGIVAKLQSLGVCGGLLQLLQDYLGARTSSTVVSGHTSAPHPVSAGVPQGSVLGPLLWNVYFNDILQLIPEAHAYADDCTLTFVCDRTDSQATITKINRALDTIVSWGRRWQVTLAPEKTQLLHISRRRQADGQPRPQPAIFLEGRRLTPQDSINILGVEFDGGLTFTSHVRRVARDASYKLGCIRRVGDVLDARGVSSLYKAQVRPVMEYAPLSWSSCPPSYLTGLERVQARARRLVRDCPRGHASDSFQPLQHRRDVAGLCVMYKAQALHTPHLAALRLPGPPPATQATRSAENPEHPHTVAVPFSRTEHNIRSFLPRYSRLWNQMVLSTDLHRSTSLHTFKCRANEWLADLQ